MRRQLDLRAYMTALYLAYFIAGMLAVLTMLGLVEEWYERVRWYAEVLLR